MRAFVLAALLPLACTAAPDPMEEPTADVRLPNPPAEPDPAVTELVSRLDIESYKATILDLTQFGDRLAGTDRNQAAVDWISEQLAGYGCAPERMSFVVEPPTPPTPVAAGGRASPPEPIVTSGEIRRSVGGSRLRGVTRPTTPNNNLETQPDPALRVLNAQPALPGRREQVYCTKVGLSHPDEMYIIGAHMDGRGFGEAANDDGSGTALVLELARLLSTPDVQTDRSIRFVLFNHEEGGSLGARAYVEQRQDLQGQETPEGSGRYPEPHWRAMIQHDMMLFDHGMPRPDGTVAPTQRAEADVNIEFQSASSMAAASMALANYVRGANERYATDYPAAVGPHMTNTDSRFFQDLIPAISLRENERGMHIGAGWDPHWHQPTDLYRTFADEDFQLGLNAAQTTLGAIAELVSLRLTP
jgi:hypothetical protein